MSIRLRTTSALLLIGLLPILIMLFLANRALEDATEAEIAQINSRLEQTGRQAIRRHAEAVAQQIKIYLDAHPRLDPFNIKALQADSALASIAVQPVGDTGYTAVHNAAGVNIFHRNPKVVNTNLADLQITLPDFWKIVEGSLDGTPTEGYYDWIEADNSIRKKYMAIVPVPGTTLRVAATTYIDEFLAPAEQSKKETLDLRQSLQSQIGLVAFIVAVLVILLAIGIGIQSTTPLINLAKVAERVAQGEWDAVQPSDEKGEIGALSKSIYAITRELQEATGNLEEQIQVRTKELSRRAAQLEAITFVASEVSRARQMDALLTETTDLIRDRFGFYHVGIFLVDETKEYASLAAAAGEIGQKLLENKYQIRLGEPSIVGTVVTTGYPRIVQDIEPDDVYFKNPLLTEARSEMAIPIRVGNETIGAIDIQSLQENAFDDEDVHIMQILADQLAGVIENIRLVERLESANKEMMAFYESQGKQTAQVWAEDKVVAYEYDRFRVQPIDDQIPADVRTQLAAGQIVALDKYQAQNMRGKPQAVLLVPIVLRGQTLGVIGMESNDPDHRWSNEEIATVENIAAQTAIALENARLLEEAQQRAVQEKAISDITAKISSSVKIESVLRITAQELSRILDDAEVLIQLEKREG